MAERRMFAKTIIDSDAFLDMPLSAQALYFHLAMRADDDGFVNSPKKIQRTIGASEDDCKLLLLKRFILAFESGVIVIKHWRIHNYVRSDRYKETLYQEEKNQLTLDNKNAYTELNKYNGIPLGYQRDTEDSIGKDSIVKISKEEIVKEESPKRFTPPTQQEVETYIKEHGYNVDAQRFVDFYASKGWMVGKNKMKDWKACVRTWNVSSKKTDTKEKNSSFDVNEFFDLATKRKPS